MPQSKKSITWPLTDGQITLDALAESDLPILQAFFRRPSDLYYYVPTLVFPRTMAQLKKMMADWSDFKRFYTFAIRQDDQLFGLLHMDEVDYVNGHAEIGIAIIEPEARGQGVASRAIRIMLRQAFEEMGLNRITARIIDGNRPSMQLFKHLGFVHEGILRQYVRRGGGFLDLHVYGLLLSDWQSLPALPSSTGHSAGQDLGGSDRIAEEPENAPQ